MNKKKSAPLGHGVGRRKRSVARVWLRRGNGKVTVNGIDHEQYFDTPETRFSAIVPFQVVPQAAKQFDIDVNVFGGGKVGQAGAIKLGLARALVENDAALRQDLRAHGLLSVDSRVKERKKYGQRGARRKFQFVKR